MIIPPPPGQPGPPEIVINKKGLALMLRTTPRSIERLIQSGQLPAPFHLGRRPYWTVSTLARHMNKLQLLAR